MTTDLLAVFHERGAVRHGHFRLSSGRHADTYVQCALALQDPALALDLGRRLATALPADRAPAAVVSPALGGVLAGFAVAAALGCRFVFVERGDGAAMSLRRGQTIGVGEPVLVVEDVLTTGGSAAEAAEVVRSVGGEVVGFAAVVDRHTDDHPLPFRATSLIRVEAATWLPADCPRCAAGEPIARPGSRPARPPRDPGGSAPPAVEGPR